MSKLEEGGIDIRPAHHLLRNEPFTMYMHVMGHGQPAKLASTLHAALLESKTSLSGGASANTPTESNIDLDAAAIDKALGYQVKFNGGVYQMNIPRADKIRDEGMEVPDFDGVGNRNQFPAHWRR
jgi:hypothetical protein